MKKLIFIMMLFVASFSFANSNVEVKSIEVIVPTTTKLIAKTETKTTGEDLKDICYCRRGICGCGETLQDAKDAWVLAGGQ